MNEANGSNYVYLCKLSSGDAWEEITKEVFENRKFALSDDGSQPRYNSDFAIMDKATRLVNINMTSCSINSVAILMRNFGITPATGSTPGGFVKTPSTILFKNNRSNSTYLLDLRTGDKYKKVS